MGIVSAIASALKLIAFVVTGIPNWIRGVRRRRLESKKARLEKKVHELEVKDAVRDEKQRLKEAREKELESVTSNDIDDHFSGTDF
ncbi:MAG: hypothetical protein V3S69_01685 [Dehalococcoidales bacterium]